MREFIILCANAEVLNNKELLYLIKYLSETHEKSNLRVIKKLYPEKYETLKNVILRNSSYYNKAIYFLDKEYPEVLREIYNPPAVLFYRGDIKLLNKKIISVVGSRNGTNYSNRLINRLIKMSNSETVFASGLASGVDSMVHKNSLLNNRKTIAVVATNILECYPHENMQLSEEIAHEGLIISEYAGNHKLRPYNFVNRNRIIAGLCESLVVTEAKQKSGALITANYAVHCNRNVYAAPGNLDSYLSIGPNNLINEGAYVLTGKEIF